MAEFPQAGEGDLVSEGEQTLTGEQKVDAVKGIPNTFVCFVEHISSPRRYTRLGPDNWDVRLWRGAWKFWDNVGDDLAVAAFSEACHKYGEIDADDCD